MKYNLPGAIMLQPQVAALEIKIDRVDFFGKEFDLEEMVLWVQVLDLPCLEMRPYQRDRCKIPSDESLDSALDTEATSYRSLSQPVRISKKASSFVAGEPNLNRSITTDQQSQRKKRLSNAKTGKIAKHSLKTETSSKIRTDSSSLAKAGSKPSLTKSESKKSLTKSLSFKINEKKDESDKKEELDKSGSATTFVSTKTKDKEDDRSQRNIKLLARLLSFPEGMGAVEGIAFNSDCCLLLPCSSVSDVLYKMERMPIVIYIIRQKPCNRLIGKVCFRLDYSFQNNVVKAAKINGAVAVHFAEKSFPIYPKTKCSKRIIGYVLGSVRLMSYGQYGVTELKSPTGDLMVGRLREYKSSLRDSEKIVEAETVVSIPNNPYGLCPLTSRNNLPPVKGPACLFKEPVHSMFQFLDNFVQPREKDSDDYGHLL